MAQQNRPLIAANWKMHGEASWAAKLGEFQALLPQSEREAIDVLICPPAILLPTMRNVARQTSILLGAQDCHAEIKGAHTGSLSSEMLAEAGADYVIVGHSERRAAGDTDADVFAKAKAAQRALLVPIICVGEIEAQRESGEALSVVAAQIEASLPKLAEYVIAYEPVWAIGTGKVATVADITEMHDSIRAQVGEGVRLLYGGSVKPANAADILAIKTVDGALIGGAGLEMDSLAQIARAALNT